MAREVHDRRQRAWRPASSYIDKADRARQPRPRAHRRARGERVRVGAAPAQLEVVEVPAGPGELERRRRQVPDRFDRRSACRGFIPKLMDGVAAQRGRRRRHAPLHAVVARQQEARFPARLSHRARRRAAHAERRVRRRHSQLHGADVPARPTAFGGYGKQLKDDYRRLLRRDGELRRPRRDDPERRHATARSIRRVVDTVGHPGAALPLQVERLRVQPGEAHAGDLPRDHHRDGRHADLADADARRRATASRPAAGSSTKSASRAWATTRRRRC